MKGSKKCGGEIVVEEGNKRRKGYKKNGDNVFKEMALGGLNPPPLPLFKTFSTCWVRGGSLCCHDCRLFRPKYLTEPLPIAHRL